MSSTAAAEGVDQEQRGTPDSLERGARGVAALVAGCGLLVATGGGLPAFAFAAGLMLVVGGGYALYVDRLHRLNHRLDDAAVIDDVRLAGTARTVTASVLRVWIAVGAPSGLAFLLVEDVKFTLEGIGTLVMAIGLSQLAGAALLRRWERRHGERVVLVEGELRRLSATPR